MSTITPTGAPSLSGAVASAQSAIERGLGRFDQAAAAVAAGAPPADALVAAIAARDEVSAGATTLRAADRMIGTLLDTSA